MGKTNSGHYLMTLLQIGPVSTRFYAYQDEGKAQGSDSIVGRCIKLASVFAFSQRYVLMIGTLLSLSVLIMTMLASLLKSNEHILVPRASVSFGHVAF